MIFSNLSLMRESREALSPYWGVGVLVAFVYALIIGAPSGVFPGTGELIPLLLAGPFSVGLALFSFSVVRKETPHFNQLFQGFQSPVFFKSFLANLCITILTVVGFVLLIIPGIIVALGFGLTFFVMADRPDLSFTDCIQESWRLMDGYKLKYLGLNIRFIPWYFLGVLCLGVGVLLVIPWHFVTIARFHEEVKAIQSV